MVEDVPNNNVQYLEKETLTRSRDLLLALGRAAQALYAAKAQGNNCTVIHQMK